MKRAMIPIAAMMLLSLLTAPARGQMITTVAGGSSPDGRSATVVTLSSPSGIALRKLPDCSEAMKYFGIGLHPVQDSFAHMDLTMMDHMDRVNGQFVDEPKYDRGPLFKRREVKPSGDRALLYRLGFSIVAKAYANSRNKHGLPTIREFHWIGVGSVGNRFLNMEKDTEWRLRALLRTLHSDYGGACTKRVAKVPQWTTPRCP